MAGEAIGAVAGTVAGGIYDQLTMSQQDKRTKKFMDIQHKNNQEMMQQQFMNQTGLNKQGHELQYEMWLKTNYPEQVKQMKAAGLNPALMYGMKGGGGATTGSQGGGSAAGGNAGLGMAASSKGADMQAGLIAAQTEMMKANARDKNADADIKEGGGSDKMAAEIENLLAQAGKNGEEMKRLELENKMTKEVWNSRVSKEINDAVLSANQAKLAESQTSLNEEQTKYISKNFEVIAGRLNNEIIQTGILKLNAESKKIEADAKRVDSLTKKIELEVRKEITQMNIDQSEREAWIKFGSKLIGDLLGLGASIYGANTRLAGDAMKAAGDAVPL